ncbi:competence protein ComK [Bacillus solimangrovi]|uniref:competence protein ComK n=1 Tax=Bacillus solimangrovi TaxID=1305675 RepID=UPI000AAD4804|nr:competence protein ComK [Bacillus solimangrovi]
MISDAQKPIKFEINENTMAIVAERRIEGSIYSRVLELDGEVVVPVKPAKIIDDSCRYFGSSLKGRQEGTKAITGISYKSPIAIDPSSGIYMFPTNSPRCNHCSWIAHQYISHYAPSDDGRTSVTFTNGQSLLLEISFRSFENQLNRTAQFRYLLSKRIQLA